MFPWFRGDGGSPRPPLPGRLAGLAVGVTLLALAVWLALHVITLVISLVVPLLGLLFVYTVIFGGFRRRR
jgi:hypothetical protein